jgi:hypothetical protein
VVIVGNSRMLAALSPAEMGRAWASQGLSAQAWNISLAGVWSLSFLAALDELGIYPRLLLLHHSAVADTPDWRQQAEQVKARLTAPPAQAGLAARIEERLVQVVKDRLSLADYTLPVWSALLGLRRALTSRDLEEALFYLNVTPYYAQRQAVDPFGYAGSEVTLKPGYFQGGREIVVGRYLDLYRRWRLTTPAEVWAGYEGYLDRFARKGSACLFVLPPVDPALYRAEYLDSGDLVRLTELCQRRGLPVLDFNAPGQGQPLPAFDGSHLDHAAARQVSARVAEFLARRNPERLRE